MSKDQKNKKALYHGKTAAMLIVAAVLLGSIIFFVTQVMNYIDARNKLAAVQAALLPVRTNRMRQK